jgi:hypothetical protein
MKNDAPLLSEEFQRLYCDPLVIDQFSALHPANFTHILPFQSRDAVVDDPSLLAAEAAHLENPNNHTRLAVLDAFGQCGLLSNDEVANLKSVVDFFDADFFEVMGEIYANAGMFICALRWHREFIVELEARQPGTSSDGESVYAIAGYCLYSLGLFPEAITWSKSCIGPYQTADTINRTLIEYEAQAQGGCIQGIERAAGRTRYLASASDPDQMSQVTSRLKDAMETFGPFQPAYVDWVSVNAPALEINADGYPFRVERDAGALPRHRMNLIFALCGQADALIALGRNAEAKRFLIEAMFLEPQVEFIKNRINAIA